MDICLIVLVLFILVVTSVWFLRKDKTEEQIKSMDRWIIDIESRLKEKEYVGEFYSEYKEWSSYHSYDTEGWRKFKETDISERFEENSKILDTWVSNDMVFRYLDVYQPKRDSIQALFKKRYELPKKTKKAPKRRKKRGK